MTIRLEAGLKHKFKKYCVSQNISIQDAASESIKRWLQSEKIKRNGGVK